MQILFENGVQVPIELTDSPAQETILSIYKHLQHVPIPFSPWDSSLYKETHTYYELLEKLVELGKQLDVDIDVSNRKQSYWNYLHQVYEENYDGQPAWLAFHEHVHMCEGYHVQEPHNTLSIDYREKSGPLEQPFNLDWLASATTKLKKGDVYLAWAELSKPPYDYWENGEPNDIERLCELAKPWLILRPKLMIALDDIDRMANRDQENFNQWWKSYHDVWCKHYQIASWTLEQQQSVLVIGKILDVDPLVDLLKNQIYPIKVEL